MDFYELIGFYDDEPKPKKAFSGLPSIGQSCIFLDFDGTLVDLADRPGEISVGPELSGLLADLLRATEGRTAIVSGRDIDTLTGFLPEFRGVMVGSHGAERRGGGLPDKVPDLPEDFDCIRKILHAYAEHHHGVLYEEKPYSVALHFRQAPDAMTAAERLLAELVKGWDSLTLHHAKMALEIMLVDISKGNAVSELHMAWDAPVPVAFGDDRTDEGMLQFSVENGGVGVKVGEGASAANHRLDAPADVRRLLRDWVQSAGNAR